MSENKTKPTEEKVEAFIRKADPKKIDDSFKLIEIMERLSGEKATMWGPSIVGFGSYHYKYATGREGDACRIGFSPRKDKFSLYILSCDSAAQNELLKKLGKIKTSVACIYFKKLEDLDLKVLEKLIKISLKETKAMWG
ncbi:DUF1801 domain-containing protein [Niabella ginsengisoli]|uniref:DUF1801 domain-containing protein n=1 Tax=Niabella ginsengisoli TaxID=522298 RepID=A0ABS9SPG2_9BACT|nr:DUF1801 domain-containing protein [Niabella ginsengisoli]MCH5600299.1 DUF1801 domain-containing protein [Niabella ginsengisoli]